MTLLILVIAALLAPGAFIYFKYSCQSYYASVRGDSEELGFIFAFRSPIPEAWAEYWFDFRVRCRAWRGYYRLINSESAQKNAEGGDAFEYPPQKSHPLQQFGMYRSITANVSRIWGTLRSKVSYAEPLWRDNFGRLTTISGRYGIPELGRSGSLHETPDYIVSDEVSPRYLITGSVALPKRIYEGNSYIVSLNMVASPMVDADGIVTEPEMEGRMVSDGLNLTIGHSVNKQLTTASMVATGFDVRGIADATIELASGAHTFSWSCWFKNPGRHEFVLAIEVSSTKSSGETRTIRSDVKGVVTVVKLDHLTSRQIWLLSAIPASIAFFLGAAKVLHDLHTW